jgi:hypothetical protein
LFTESGVPPTLDFIKLARPPASDKHSELIKEFTAAAEQQV